MKMMTHDLNIFENFEASYRLCLPFQHYRLSSPFKHVGTSFPGGCGWVARIVENKANLVRSAELKLELDKNAPYPAYQLNQNLFC